MKNITMFITDWCPYCKKAINWVDEIKQENPQYKNIKVEIVDEEKQPDIAKQYDYYYVPTYYIGNKKIYEGGTSKDILKKVFQEASQ